MFILGLATGIVLCLVTIYILLDRKNDGTVLVYPPTRENPLPYLFLELDPKSKDIQNKSHVIFKVKEVPSVSQK